MPKSIKQQMMQDLNDCMDMQVILVLVKGFQIMVTMWLTVF